MAKEEKKYSWFVEPKTKSANEDIARFLRDDNEVNTSELIDDQGFPRKVYELPDFTYITRFYHSHLKSPADFAVFRRQGHNDPIIFWTKPGPIKKPVKEIKK